LFKENKKKEEQSLFQIESSKVEKSRERTKMEQTKKETRGRKSPKTGGQTKLQKESSQEKTADYSPTEDPPKRGQGGEKFSEIQILKKFNKRNFEKKRKFEKKLKEEEKRKLRKKELRKFPKKKPNIAEAHKASES
jgi:hypothetical protein